MNKITNRQAICDILLEASKTDLTLLYCVQIPEVPHL